MEHKVYIPWEDWNCVKAIGQGGFGTVYEIERVRHGIAEKAAMKKISIPRNPSDVEDLQSAGYDNESITHYFSGFAEDIVREYGMMVRLKGNANIVYCDDYKIIQQDDGIGWDIYIKMELLTPLMKAMDLVATEDQIVRLGIEMCAALEVCQKRNVIHRDIKPQNIFVSDDGVFKLGDFGVARTAEKTTRATAGIGTYRFMAPEVKNGQQYGASADIYSLGLVLYWLLNARRGPFLPLPPAIPKLDDEELARQRRFTGDPIPEPMNGSAELKRIVLKACAFDPEKRYQSAWEMREDLIAIGGMPATTAFSGLRDDNGAVDSTVGPANKKARAEKIADVTVGLSFAYEEHYKPADPDVTVGPVSKKEKVAEDPEKTVGPTFKPAANAQITDPDKTVGRPVRHNAEQTSKAQQKKNKLWMLIAGLLICVILGGVFLLSRPVVTMKVPTGEILQKYLVSGHSAIGCYEVRTTLPLGDEVTVKFKVGDAYNASIVRITGAQQKTPLAVTVSGGVATAKLAPNGTYLLQINTK